MKPGGKELGVRARQAGDGILTLNRTEFDKLKSDLLDGAKEVPSPRGYDGQTYQRPDGSIVGVRISKKFGETLEVLKSLEDTRCISNE